MVTMSFARRRANTGSVGWAVVAGGIALGASSVVNVRADLTTETHNGLLVPPHSSKGGTFTLAEIVIPFDEEHDFFDNEGAGGEGGLISEAFTSYVFENVNGGFQFSVGFDHTLSAQIDSFAKSNGSILFRPVDTPEAGTDFEFAGEFSLDLPDGYDYGGTLEIDLFEVGNAEPLFHIDSVLEEGSFDFTVMGEDKLLPSVVYELRYKYEIVVGTHTGDPSPGGAAGGFTFDLLDAGGVTIVPVPGAALLAMIGLSLVGWRQRRSRA